jgi:hypothetical protein
LWARASLKLELEQGSRQALSDFSNALTCVLYQEQSATLSFVVLGFTKQNAERSRSSHFSNEKCLTG